MLTKTQQEALLSELNNICFKFDTLFYYIDKANLSDRVAKLFYDDLLNLEKTIDQIHNKLK